MRTKIIDPIEKFKENNKNIIRTVPVKNPNALKTSEYAKLYIKNLDELEKNRLRKMLKSNTVCFESIANVYGIDKEDFVKEVKLII